jgi:alkylated DNA repair protein alkB family protein 1
MELNPILKSIAIIDNDKNVNNHVGKGTAWDCFFKRIRNYEQNQKPRKKLTKKERMMKKNNLENKNNIVINENSASTSISVDDFDWSHVIDVRNYSGIDDCKIKDVTNTFIQNKNKSNEINDIISVSPNARVFEVVGLPKGFYIIESALTKESQYVWAKIALEKYSTAEHNNISNLCNLTRIENNKDQIKESKEITEEEEEDKIENNNIWLNSIENNDNFLSFQKLRWSSLGYHYDWTARKYQKSVKSPFPEELSKLSTNLAALVGENLKPEAAIVNYYPVGTYMSGHIDDAELTMEEPIVSISLGISAAFCIGTRSKSDKPNVILIKSGDCIVMSGESRYSYHGVPFLFPNGHNINNNNYNFEGIEIQNSEINESQLNNNTDNVTDDHILSYLKNNRINMNVRRVTNLDNIWIDKHGTGVQPTVPSSFFNVSKSK